MWLLSYSRTPQNLLCRFSVHIPSSRGFSLYQNLSGHHSLFSVHMLFLQFFSVHSRVLFATRTPNSQNHSCVHCSLSKFTGAWFTNHSNHIHIFTPITRIVATKSKTNKMHNLAKFGGWGSEIGRLDSGSFGAIDREVSTVPKPGCFKPGCLQFSRRSALLHVLFLRPFAPFCAH